MKKLFYHFQTSNGKDLIALQARQTEIIKQLEQLRLKLNEMQTKLGVNECSLQKAQKVQNVQKKAPVIKPIDVCLMECIR